MKKIIFPALILSLFFISAGKEPTRFTTPEEMAKALLSAFQKNDSLRFLEIYPSHDETFAAFATPWKDSSLYEHQKSWVEKYYVNNSERARSMFRETRQRVIDAKIDWNNVTFVSVSIDKEKKRSPGIDYLYSSWVNYISDGRKIELRLSDIMKTAAGWNCGLGMRVSSIESTKQEEADRILEMQADSARMSDSIQAVINYLAMEMKADSARIADSIQMAEDMKKAKKKNPR